MRLTTQEQRQKIFAERPSIPLTDTYSIQPYPARVPNRTALGSVFQTEKAECAFVSLPLLSIQRREV